MAWGQSVFDQAGAAAIAGRVVESGAAAGGEAPGVNRPMLRRMSVGVGALGEITVTRTWLGGKQVH